MPISRSAVAIAGADRGGQRRLAGSGAVVGRLALRDDADAAPSPHPAPRGPDAGRETIAGRHHQVRLPPPLPYRMNE